MKLENFRTHPMREVKYFIPEIWWMASALQWCAFGIVVVEVKCSRNKVRW